MSSFLQEAFKGAKADIDSAGGELMPKLARAARVARILGVEIAAIVALAPYGLYAMSVYRSLTALPDQLPAPSSPPGQQNVSPGPDLATALSQLSHGRYGVAVQRQVPYGPAPRNVLDIYVPLLGTHLQQQQQQQHPPHHQKQQQQQQLQQRLPVVFFLHGGVWASGETWQYAPMATRLAQAGLIVVVPTYTLYPETLTGTMVEEVSAAMTWTFDNVARYGGDPAHISAVGHSAGGHLIAWALLRRAAAAAGVSSRTASAAAGMATTLQNDGGIGAVDGLHEPPMARRQDGARRHNGRHDEDEQPQGSAAHSSDPRDTAAYLLGGGGTSLSGALHALRAVADAQLHPKAGVDMSYDDGSAAAAAGAAAAAPSHAEVDTRMPAVFVGMSAVYDIAKHYEFEKARAVQELSMMKRAVGGPAGFAAASPTVILARAADAAEGAASDAGPRVAAGADGGHFTSFFTSFELLGDAIPSRAGLADPAVTAAAGGGGGGGSGPSGQSEPFSLAAAARLPPFVVMGSGSDHMVPWHEGAELVLQLRRCGVPVRHLLYNHVGHGDFVMSWRPLKVADMATAAGPATAGMHPEGSSAASDGGADQQLVGLLPCARDLLKIVTGQVQPVAAAAAALSSFASRVAIAATAAAAAALTRQDAFNSETGAADGAAPAVAARSKL